MTIRITALNPQLVYEAGSTLTDPEAVPTPLPTGTCCEFAGPGIGDSSPVITVTTGGSAATDVTIWAEGCECGYTDIYGEYCDVTEGGVYPNASITDTEYRIADLPANSMLVIDAVEEKVTLTDDEGMVQTGGVEALEWAGIFEWIRAAKGGCQRVCVDVGSGSADVEILVYDREW